VRTILIFDMSYTLTMFDELGNQMALESRRLGGYFGTVISVHPLAFLHESTPRFGPPEITLLANGDFFLSGKRGRYELLRFFPLLNFLISQIQLLSLILRLCKRLNVSVVRIGDPYYLGLWGILISKIKKVPLVIRVCANYDEIVRVSGRAVMPRLFRFRKIEKIIERFVFPRCSLIAGANQDNLNYAVANGGSGRPAAIFRYGNLLDPAHWRPPDARQDAGQTLLELGLSKRRFIVTIARLEKVKRIDHVLRVVDVLSERGVDMFALIIGDGSERHYLESLAEKLKIANRIKLVGARSQEWIARVLPLACVVAAPHMGRALAEAALASLPLVAYDFDWQRELVRDGINGFLIRDGEVLEMAEKISLIFSDPQMAKVMGERSREIASKMMDSNLLELHERQVYSNLLENWNLTK